MGPDGGVFGCVCGCGWKELDENFQGFVGPEETENGPFEGFAAAGGRDCSGYTLVPRVPDNDSWGFDDPEGSAGHLRVRSG